MPRVRIPRPKLAKADHHGQSLHNRELAEIEELEAVARQPAEHAWIDDLWLADEMLQWQHDHSHVINVDGRIYTPEEAKAQLIRYGIEPWADKAKQSDKAVIFDPEPNDRPMRPRPRVEPHLPNIPTPDIVIVRTL